MGVASSLAESLSVSLVILFIFTIIGSGPEPEVGGFLGQIFEVAHSIVGGNSVLLAAFIFALILIKTLLGLLYGLVIAFVSNEMNETIRNRIHEQYLEVSYDYVRRHDQGELLNVLATASWTVAEAWHCLLRIAVSICAVCVFGTFVLTVSWQIALIAAIGSSLLWLMLKAMSRRARRLGEQAMQANRQLAERMLKTLQGMRAIRAFGQEAAENERFRKASRRVRRAFVDLEKLSMLVNPIGEVGYLALLGVIIIAAGPLGISAVETLTALALLYRLQPYIRELESNRLKLAGLEAPLRVVRSVLDRSDKTYLPTGDTPFCGLVEVISFRRVSLSHGGADRPSLRDASFSIRRGAVTAILGPSGAGKTTIVNLLLRLYRPDDGSIEVDGVPLERLERSSWLSRVAVAGQDAELIEGTVAENIGMARPGAGPTQIRTAAATAGILDFIEGLPDGFDTWIGERGLNLSGGQRQRVGLARALACDPEVLILDEATSAVDGQLEEEIRLSLLRRLPHMTLVVITHRLGSVASADHVVCLADGAVVEEGPPHILRSTPSSAFRKMIEFNIV